MCFFFFKHKTAYEMRISDWSSDVCSSDLWVRAGKGPVLMELKTYRYRGHSMSDPAKYRSREEVQAVRDKSDSIEHLKKLMTDAGISEDKFKVIDKEIRAIVAESADFAESAPEPELHELYTDVLVEQY